MVIYNITVTGFDKVQNRLETLTDFMANVGSPNKGLLKEIGQNYEVEMRAQLIGHGHVATSNLINSIRVNSFKDRTEVKMAKYGVALSEMRPHWIPIRGTDNKFSGNLGKLRSWANMKYPFVDTSLNRPKFIYVKGSGWLGDALQNARERNSEIVKRYVDNSLRKK